MIYNFYLEQSVHNMCVLFISAVVMQQIDTHLYTFAFDFKYWKNGA